MFKLIYSLTYRACKMIWHKSCMTASWVLWSFANSVPLHACNSILHGLTRKRSLDVRRPFSELSHPPQRSLKSTFHYVSPYKSPWRTPSCFPYSLNHNTMTFAKTMGDRRHHYVRLRHSLKFRRHGSRKDFLQGGSQPLCARSRKKITHEY